MNEMRLFNQCLHCIILCLLKSINQHRNPLRFIYANLAILFHLLLIYEHYNLAKAHIITIFRKISHIQPFSPFIQKNQLIRLFYAISTNHYHSWSGRRGSNPRPSAWEADALPTELLPQKNRFYLWFLTSHHSVHLCLTVNFNIFDGHSVAYRPRHTLCRI